MSESDAETFGQEFEALLLGDEPGAAAARFDADMIGVRVCDGLEGPASKVAEFRTGLVQGVKTSLAGILRMWAAAMPTYKGVRVADGARHARFRLVVPAGGIAFIDLRLEPGEDGRPVVTDFLNHASGSHLTDDIRQGATLAMAALDRGFLRRVFGGRTADENDLRRFAAMAQRLLKEDFAGCIAEYGKLSAQGRNGLPAMRLAMAAYQRSSDNAGYHAILRKAAALHDSPSLEFMLIDLHILDGEFDRALRAIDRFMTAVERDAGLLALRAGVQIQKGDIPDARKTLDEAFALEPDFPFPHAIALDLFLATKDYAGVVRSITVLEASGRYTFKGNLVGPIWADFVQTPESAPWR